ncbi:hypothetical protein KUTeg_008932, partial [Tegillarca granosa]
MDSDEKTPLIHNHNPENTSTVVDFENNTNRTSNFDNHANYKYEGLHQHQNGNALGKNGHLYHKHKSMSVSEVVEPLALSWKDVNVYIVPKNETCKRTPAEGQETKHILRSVTGLVKPGTLLAIIGASGAGKSTLMNVLTYRNKGQLVIQGDVRINGIEVGHGIHNVSAYVQQDDLFVGTLTVREHLTFRALLRMDNRLTRRQRLVRVEEVLKELGLVKCADTMIGYPGRLKGISGGEMKRLSFASEILTNPPLIFCDEPTSGLDAFMAQNVVQTLKTMANRGRTVLCTIHQPSSEVYNFFDEVLILAEGRTAYMGPVEDSLAYFSRLGYNCPLNYNPADFYITTLAIIPGREEECHQRVEKICDAFDNSPMAATMVRDMEESNKSSHVSSSILFEEAFKDSSRYSASVFQQFTCLLWRSWINILRDPMVFRVRVGQTLLFSLELPVFRREYFSGLYSVAVYYLSKTVAEIPTYVFFPSLFVSVIYWMIGSSIPDFLVWLKYLSWFLYSNELLVINQWEDIENI